jgi:hypothetical protein
MAAIVHITAASTTPHSNAQKLNNTGATIAIIKAFLSADLPIQLIELVGTKIVHFFVVLSHLFHMLIPHVQPKLEWEGSCELRRGWRRTVGTEGEPFDWANAVRKWDFGIASTIISVLLTSPFTPETVKLTVW